MNALITDIQRFSLSDGDGIRTTVFFKGCNMHCSWCHNPETLSEKRELMFYETKCIGCGRCFGVCPKKAHSVQDGRHVIDRSLCTSCGKCAEVCFAEALVMCGRSMSVGDIMREILQDKAYYENSGGGVTISGGEVLLHAAFACEIAENCHKEGIKVALETNLSIPFDEVKDLLKAVDLIMCDIKIFDDDEHKKYTGLSNKVVLENIKKIDSLGIPLVVRTPIIPGATDSEENIKNIALYISGLENLKRYELLNFNPLGEAKYRGLGKANDFEKQRPLQAERLEKLKKTAETAGICVKVG